MEFNQENYDKLIAIASSMSLVLRLKDTHSIQVNTCHGINEGKQEIMTMDKIEEFLDSMFEHEVE